MGWGMAVCSLEGTHAILLCCLVPEVLWVEPAWAMTLCCPQGPVQRMLQAQAEVSQRSVLTPSDLAQPSGHRDLLTLPQGLAGS